MAGQGDTPVQWDWAALTTRGVGLCFLTSVMRFGVSIPVTRQGWGWAEGLLGAPAPSQPLGLQAAHPGAESSPAGAVLC